MLQLAGQDLAVLDRAILVVLNGARHVAQVGGATGRCGRHDHRTRADIGAQHFTFTPVENVIHQIVSFASQSLFLLICVILLVYLRGRWVSELKTLTVTIVMLITIYTISKLVLLPNWFLNMATYFVQFVLCSLLLVAVREEFPAITLPKLFFTLLAMLFFLSAAILEHLITSLDRIHPEWSRVADLQNRSTAGQT